jgi:hypothetical protein
MAESVSQQDITPLDSEEFFILSRMGFLGEETETMDKDSKFTRAQFVGTLFRIAGYDAKKYATNENPFLDISADNPYRTEIIGMYNMGIIAGTSKNTFSPDEPITYNQATAIAIKVLGYKDYADKKYSNLPDPYVVMARMLDLNVGVDAIANDELTATQAVKFLYNTARCDIMEQTTVDTEGSVSYKVRDIELISSLNKYYYAEGILESDGIASLTKSEARLGYAVISGKTYKLDNLSIGDLLGNKIKYFYKDEEACDVLVSAAIDEDDNRVLVIESKDLAVDDPSYSLTNIVYSDDDDLETAKIDVYADVVWNFRPCYNKPITPHSGYVKLIDINNDKKYDKVIVEEFDNMFIRYVSIREGIIAGKYNKFFKVSDYKNVQYIMDGQQIAIDQIPPMSVASYVKTDDKEHLIIYVSSMTLTETVKMTTVKNGEIWYTLSNSGQYKEAYNMQENRDNGYAVKDIKIGGEYKFHLDKEGNIAEVEELGDGKEYALITDYAEVEKDFSTEKHFAFSVLTIDGNRTTAEVAENVVLNGVAKKNYDWSIESRLFNSSGAFEVQVVRLRFNSQGYITAFDFAADSSASEYGYDPTQFSLDCAKDSSIVYNNANQAYFLDGKYHVNSDTPIFAKYTSYAYDDPYFVINQNLLTSPSKYRVYDCNSTLAPEVIYCEIGMPGPEYVVLVEEVVETVHNDGEVYKNLYGWWWGRPWDGREMTQGVIPEGLKRGDVVVITKMTPEKLIAVCEKALSLSDPSAKTRYVKDGKLTGSATPVYGPLYSVGDMGIVIGTPTQLQNMWGEIMGVSYGSRTGTYYERIPVYDVKKDTIYIIDKNTLNQYCQQLADGSMPADDKCSVWMLIQQRYQYMDGCVAVIY